MSIINEMLHKLEQRRGGRDSSLPEGVRAVAKVSDPRSRRLLLIRGTVVAILVAGASYSGWLWWQQHSKPAKSVAVIGKVPGAAAPTTPKVQVPAVPIPDDTQALIDAIKAEKDTGAGPAGGSPSGNAQKKVKPTRQGAAGPKTDGEKDEDTHFATTPDAHSFTVKKPSRESTGKIRITREGQESNVKLVTPQQLALSHYQKALSWLQQGRVAEARSGLEEALKLDPTYLSARQALAGLLVDRRHFGQAELVLQEGLNFNPEQQGFAMALARLQVERGDTRNALDTLYKYLPYAFDNADYQAFIAALQQRSEQHKKAIEHYQAALRLVPSGAWYMGLGISLQAEHRLDEAQEAFGKARASNELAPELLAFVEQRLRGLKKMHQSQVPGDAK